MTFDNDDEDRGLDIDLYMTGRAFGQPRTGARHRHYPSVHGDERFSDARSPAKGHRKAREGARGTGLGPEPGKREAPESALPLAGLHLERGLTTGLDELRGGILGPIGRFRR